MDKGWRWVPVVLASFTWGCTTTPEVRELSRVTAINAGLLTSELQRYAEDEKRFAEARTANVQELHDRVAVARERFEVDRLLTRDTEGAKFEKLEKELNALIMEIDKVRKQARDNRVVVTAPAPAPVSVDERVSALAALAKSMGTLAKPSDRKTDLIFLRGYIDSVRKQVEAATESPEPMLDVQIKTLANVKETNNGEDR